VVVRFLTDGYLIWIFQCDFIFTDVANAEFLFAEG
jgi:hypothetical protein